MSNAYGLSIYFPYRSSAKYVDSMSRTYSEIGMDADYTSCIREFASLQVSGQAAGGGTGSPYNALFGDYAGEFSGLDSTGTDELIGALLSEFLGGGYGRVSDMSADGASFLSDRAMSEEETQEYLTEKHFDATQLAWTEVDGRETIELDETQWNLVTDLKLNTFADVGNGYADLGCDTVYDFDDEGRLIADEGKYWISINGQPVAYYHLDTIDDGTSYSITGRVPCLINGEYNNLLLVFDTENEAGYVAGVMTDYSQQGNLDISGKTALDLQKGDQIQFICDLYEYDGTFQDKYLMGTPITIEESVAELVVSNTTINQNGSVVTYVFTDIYGAEHWTQALFR
jgi:hypothetical protein